MEKQPLKILVVDDNIDAADSLSMLLRRLGNSVEAVYTSREAIPKALEFKPQVVLLDIGLPGMDGYEVAGQIKSNASLKGIKLLAVTGYGLSEDKEKSSRAGFDGHLTKPVSIDLLKETFSQLF